MSTTYDPHADAFHAALRMANPLSTLYIFYTYVSGIVCFCSAGSSLLLFYSSFQWPLLLGITLAFGALALYTGHRTMVRMRLRKAAWEVRSARDRERGEGEERVELLSK
jgi:hypothetical protein